MSMQTNSTAVRQAVQDDEINLMDLLLVIAKHNRFIIKLTAGAAVLTVIYALLQPNLYTAKTVLMPPQQASSSASALLGQLGGLAGMAGGALGVKNPGDLYIGMLKSHMIEDALIKRFNLMEVYEAKTMEPVRAALEGSTVIAAGKDGFITVEYSDKDPKLAAAIANAYVEELDSLVRAQAAREALGRKQFYEKQLGDVRANLGRAELEMKVFQEQNRVFQLGGGAGVALGASGGIPKAELEYVRIARDVKYNEILLAAMAQQVTSATIDAAKNLPTVQVLDRALPPEKKSKPKRALIVMLATILAFFIGIIWAFIRETGGRAGQNPEQAERMNTLSRYLRRGK